MRAILPWDLREDFLGPCWEKDGSHSGFVSWGTGLATGAVRS